MGLWSYTRTEAINWKVVRYPVLHAFYKSLFEICIYRPVKSVHPLSNDLISIMEGMGLLCGEMLLLWSNSARASFGKTWCTALVDHRSDSDDETTVQTLSNYMANLQTPLAGA